MRRVVKVVGFGMGVVVLLVGGFLVYATITEYKPAAVEPLKLAGLKGETRALAVGDTLTAVTFNIGYAGLGKDQDFFMDGGDMVRPSEQAVKANLAGLAEQVAANPADVAFLQEVDIDSHRSHGTDQRGPLAAGHYANQAFAYNFNSLFTPYPWPPIGHVESGLVTMTGFEVSDAERHALTSPFSWPVRLFNLKRALLVERVPLTGSEAELVLVNFHLEAYDSGAGRAKQLEELLDFAEAEYAKGNYVLAGGDFNTALPGAEYPVLDTTWQPGRLGAQDLPAGWTLANDPTAPTLRLNNQPYSGDRSQTQLFGIDGYIVSPNLEVVQVKTLDLDFEYSDHNPVRIEVRLT